jgi:hypothetical protein
MSTGVLVSLLSLALLQAPASSQPSLSDKRAVLRTVVAITTLPSADITRLPASAEVEHDSEVARSEKVTVVVTIQGCQGNPAGVCEAAADVVAYRPDGTVHSELKNISLASGRGMAILELKPDDVTGVYKVEATVRDPNARRVAKADRLFGVK